MVFLSPAEQLELRSLNERIEGLRRWREERGLLEHDREELFRLETLRIEFVNSLFCDVDELDVMREAVWDLCDLYGDDDPNTFSKTRCRKELKRVKISLLDYLAGRFECKCGSLTQLRNRCNNIGLFPREDAKSDGLRCFLQVLNPLSLGTKKS